MRRLISYNMHQSCSQRGLCPVPTAVCL